MLPSRSTGELKTFSISSRHQTRDASSCGHDRTRCGVQNVFSQPYFSTMEMKILVTSSGGERRYSKYSNTFSRTCKFGLSSPAISSMSVSRIGYQSLCSCSTNLGPKLLCRASLQTIQPSLGEGSQVQCIAPLYPLEVVQLLSSRCPRCTSLVCRSDRYLAMRRACIALRLNSLWH